MVEHTMRERRQLVEGEDYYMEGGLMVFTSRYLLRRGYCCLNGCRHCPYRESARADEKSEGDENESK